MKLGLHREPVFSYNLKRVMSLHVSANKKTEPLWDKITRHVILQCCGPSYFYQTLTSLNSNLVAAQHLPPGLETREHSAGPGWRRQDCGLRAEQRVRLHQPAEHLLRLPALRLAGDRPGLPLPRPGGNCSAVCYYSELNCTG